MSPDLHHWLAIHYRAKVMKEGKVDEALKVFADRLEADQRLMAEARKEKSRIEALAAFCGGESQMLKRCYASAIHLEALSKVIPT